MTLNTEEIDRTEPELTREEQLLLLQTEVTAIFSQAMTSKVSLQAFALEVWVNAVQGKRAYVAIAGRMINLATGFQNDESLNFLRFLAAETLAKNVEKSQWAVQLIYNGLVINNRSEVKEA